jgi:pyrroloquinoline-quinone synthase
MFLAAEPWSPEKFTAAMRHLRASYHLEHPFEKLLRAGELSREQLGFWTANRFYYQKMIPRKDAAILANCPDREVRRAWVPRLYDHDGEAGGGETAGGIEAWLQFGAAVGLDRAEMLAETRVVPGVRFAVDAYYNFARTAPWYEGVCSSLTELFAGEAHARRLAAFREHYRWIPESALEYFTRRQQQVGRDLDCGLKVTLAQFTTRPLQERALEIIRFKLDVLWAMSDAIYHNCVTFPRRS